MIARTVVKTLEGMHLEYPKPKIDVSKFSELLYYKK
jgi:hypothetical protein